MIDFIKKKTKTLKPDLVMLAFSTSMIAKSLRSNNSKSPPVREPQVDKTLLKKQLRLASLGMHKLLYSTDSYAKLDTNFRKRLYKLGVIEDNLNKPLVQLLHILLMITI